MFAEIGANALYLMYLWLLSAIVGSYLSDRKGYGSKVGLAFGLLLSAVGALIWLIVPAFWRSRSFRRGNSSNTRSMSSE